MLPSGLIYVPRTFQDYEDWLTSFRRDSPASRILSQENEPVPWISEISGLILSESLMQWDPLLSSWKMSQVSLLTGTQVLWSESWPQQGMTLCGACFRQAPLEHLILGRGGGAWPTPTASERPNQDGEVIPSERSLQRFKNGDIARIRKTRAPTLTTLARKWPTPRANLITTVTVTAAERRLGKKRLEDWAATRQVQTTPKDGLSTTPTSLSLNPLFVEWLMGVPIGWTDLKPLVTESYQAWWLSFSGE